MSEDMEMAIEFANKVRAELRHLPTETIADLTDGLEVDIASSLADGAELGSPEKYATDLMIAAGLSMPNADNHSSVKDNFDRVSQIIRKTWNSISDLAPAWWVFRAWVATQLIGLFLFHEPNGSPGFYEWNNRPYVGFALFVVLAALSVHVGRMNIAKLRPLLSVSHVLLTVGAILMMFSSPRIHEWYVYQSEGPYPTTTMADQTNCMLQEVPNVSGLLVSDAQRIIDAAQLDYRFFSPTYGKVNVVPPESVVVSQEPAPPATLCMNDQIELWIEWKNPTTTQAPQNIQTTTTAPKATTTTKP